MCWNGIDNYWPWIGANKLTDLINFFVVLRNGLFTTVMNIHIKIFMKMFWKLLLVHLQGLEKELSWDLML